MPELPELVNYKNYIDATSLHQKVDAVTVNDDQVLSHCTAEDLAKNLVGTSFESTSRYGKYLFVHPTNDHDLVLHFGMTGEPVYYLDESKEPEFSRVIFAFANGYHLAYNCTRMLGEVTLADDEKQFIEDKELGPDVYKDDFDFETFRELLQNRRGMIKSALMDQELMAGLGNECSDEILYQARFHPKTDVQNLDTDQLRNLYKTMNQVLEQKIAADLKGEDLPDSYILANREEGADCPRCDGTIQRITVAGRSGYYCPQCQKR